MDTTRLLLACLLLATAGDAGADGLSYNYLELAAGHQSRDDFDGYNSGRLTLDLALTDRVFIAGRFARSDYGNYRHGGYAPGLVQDNQSVSAGVHLPLAGSADAVLRLGYLHANTTESGSRGGSSTGATYGAGMRWAVTPPLEVYAFYDRDNAEFDPTGLQFTFGHLTPGVWENVLSTGVRWHVTQTAVLGATFEFSSYAGDRRNLVTVGIFF